MVGNERSGDKPGHPFYGNQHGTGRRSSGEFGKASRKYAGPSSRPPASSRTTKHPEIRGVVDDFIMGHKHEGGKVYMHPLHQNEKIETLHVYRNGVLIEDNPGEEEGCNTKSHSSLPDSDTIHNHPSGAVSFSGGDLTMTMAFNGRSASVVSKDGRMITLHRPKNGWKPLMEKILGEKITTAFGEELKSTARQISWKIEFERDKHEASLGNTEWYKNMKERAKKGEITTNDIDIAVRMETSKYALKLYGFDYEEGEIDK